MRIRAHATRPAFHVKRGHKETFFELTLMDVGSVCVVRLTVQFC